MLHDTKPTVKQASSEMSLEAYFCRFREHVIGIDQTFDTPFGKKRIIYADWTASGRLYRPIEELMMNEIAPFVGNTHTETTVTGCSMTLAYQKAKHVIKEHVGARQQDVLISANSGMTGVVNKFQRILGIRVHERFRDMIKIEEKERPIVFVSHMEHHSNQTSWLETMVDLEIINPTADGLVDLNHLEELLDKYKDRDTKIAAVTSCSNVTGIKTPYHQIARKMHEQGGFCFVDFACSAPYIEINMRPEEELEHLDAIYFSPHKFLGGPATTGILLFDPKMYKNRIPDNPGGGTVDWTNPWGEHKYLEEIEAREDGGTPAFLQTVKVALCTKLKDEMGVKNILDREAEIIDLLWKGMSAIPNLHILADQHSDRLGVISFCVDNLHYNLAVKLLNDRFGIQVRGGCSCAGTYGHYLLEVSQEISNSMTSQINAGDLSGKLGWVRLSIHPIMTNEDVLFMIDALEQLCEHHVAWGKDYEYHASCNEFIFKGTCANEQDLVDGWFGKSLG